MGNMQREEARKQSTGGADQFQVRMAKLKNCNDIAAAEQPIKVGSFKPNRLELYDMVGGAHGSGTAGTRINQCAPATVPWVEDRMRLALFGFWFLKKTPRYVRPQTATVNDHQRAIILLHGFRFALSP